MIENLMLIDDNAIDQKLYKQIIERSGRVVHLHQFTMAEEALAFLASDERPQIDAILLDIRMPRMDGFEFLDAAVAQHGENFAKVAVIMLTTSMSDADQSKARDYQVVKHYINKPLTTEHLVDIDKMLEGDAR